MLIYYKIIIYIVLVGIVIWISVKELDLFMDIFLKCILDDVYVNLISYLKVDIFFLKFWFVKC